MKQKDGGKVTLGGSGAGTETESRSPQVGWGRRGAGNVLHNGAGWMDVGIGLRLPLSSSFALLTALL